jgi:hypothetical protein
MTLGSNDTRIPETFPYMVNNGYLGGYIPADSSEQGISSADVVFVASLMGSPETKSSPLDLWGNVKIPRIEGYEGAASPDGEGWYNTHERDVDSYSSLVGIPVAGINEPNFINYTTRIHTPYLSLQCSLNTTVSDKTSMKETVLPELSSEASSSGSRIFWDVPTLQEQAIDSNIRNRLRDTVVPEAALPLKIKYVPLYSDNFTLTCNVTQSYIEAEIQCPTVSTCAPNRIRRAKLDQFPPNWTLLDISWRTLVLVFQCMLENFRGKSRSPQLFDRYLSDPNLIRADYANVSQTTEENYTIRLGQMINSYFACLNGFFAITRGISNDTAYFWDNNQTFTMEREEGHIGLWEEHYNSTASKDTFKTKAWSSDGTKIERKEVIVAHRGWVVALSFASIVLIVSSRVSPIPHYFFTIGVDVTMNISSLATRHNPHMSLPQKGTYLDASDRARLLRKQKVRFGDVDGAADIGHLAVGSCKDDQHQCVIMVRKGRLYE